MYPAAAVFSPVQSGGASGRETYWCYGWMVGREDRDGRKRRRNSKVDRGTTKVSKSGSASHKTNVSHAVQ